MSEFLAARVQHVHIFEVDSSLKPALTDALDRFANVELRIEDAVRADLGALEPQPHKLVANLPYSVAAPLILKTVVEQPQIELWCAMVQREIANRLVAQPGSKAYGIPSVIAQLACTVKTVRTISRTVFVPVPRVDSALVVLKRTRPFPGGGLRAFVAAAFAHRRKAMARSVTIAVADDPRLSAALNLGSRDTREVVREALTTLGKPVDCRAETLAPIEFERISELIAGQGKKQ